MTPRITGFGYHVPQKVRGNDAPIFDWLKAHPQDGRDLFQGYVERRVLDDGEDLMTVMVPAANQALAAAGIAAGDVDVLLGCASVSPCANPNELSRLHQELGLPTSAWVLPLNNEFTNFNAALLLADGLIRAGRARHVLVALGGNWTRHVDYHTPQSVSAGDGAGAVVMAPCGDEAQAQAQWEVVDHLTITETKYYGSMFMQGQRSGQAHGGGSGLPGDGALWTEPFFQITPLGGQGFAQFGEHEAPDAVIRLLRRNGLTGADVALIAHQASSVLLQAWQAAIQPAQLLQTIAQYANMTVASIALNFAWAMQSGLIAKDHLVLLGLGVDMHANALLLRRAQAAA